MDPIHVLALDGGGMRGLYAATVLHTLADRFSRAWDIADLDLGRGFDLVLGTSTGAILAAGIAAGVPIAEIVTLYEEAGPKIFKKPVPPHDKSFGICRKAKFWWWALSHMRRPAHRNCELQSELKRLFGDLTFGQLYERRGIGLCIAATALLNHKPRVFKTRHVPQKNLDDTLTIADVCLASSAAPLFLPLAEVQADDMPDHVFVDGGL